MPVKNTPQSMLFELSRPETAGPSFLFGTVHLRDRRAFAHFEKAKEAIARCERFAAEFDLREADPAVFEKTKALPDGLSLDGLLTPSVFKKLEKRLWKTARQPVEAVRRAHPMMVAAMLAEPFFGEENPLSLDEALIVFAEKQGLEITGVETFAEQTAIFEAIPLDVAAANLTSAIKNNGRSKKQAQRLLDFYEKGDVRQLFKSARRQARGLRGLLVHDRNEVMTGRISTFSMEKPTFSAIGAGHLGGKKGVLAELKRAGWRVVEI